MTAPLAYLGPPIDHQHSLACALRQTGRELVVIPDFPAWADEHLPSPHAASEAFLSRVARLRAQLGGTAHPQYLAHALDLIDRHQVRHVLALWGTRPLADIRALKRLRPHVKFILHLLCHPLGFTPAKVRLQNLILDRAMPTLDGLVLSSTVMQSYIAQHLPAARAVTQLVSPPSWCAEYASPAALPPTAERPNILFMGRMDWKRGQPTDNVTADLQDLMHQSIDVHFSRSPESQIEQPHAHPFDYIALPQMASFAAPFDASLIVYNLAAAARTDRFDITVPDRLITSVCAGIPIALPAQGYAACKEYLRPYGAVLEYSSMPHLAELLRDREAITRLRDQAHRQSAHYRAEQELPRLLDFLKHLP